MRGVAAFLLLASACTAAPYTPPTPAPTGTDRAAIGQTIAFEGKLVTPLSVVEDSRCPADVQCVWAGRLVVRTRIGYRGGSEELVINLTLGQAGVAIDGGRLALVAAGPVKNASNPIRPGDYRFVYAFEP